MTHSTNKTAPHGEVLHDDHNAQVVSEFFAFLDSQAMFLWNVKCNTNYELLEQIAAIVAKRKQPTHGMRDDNTYLVY